MSRNLDIAGFVLSTPRLAFLRPCKVSIVKPAFPASVYVLVFFLHNLDHRIMVPKNRLSGDSPILNSHHELRIVDNIRTILQCHHVVFSLPLKRSSAIPRDESLRAFEENLRLL